MKYPDTELQDAPAPSAGDVARMAGEDFDAWCAAHDDEIADMDLLERIEVYSNDCAWHSRETKAT